jgi:hypothetical protein
MTAKRVFGYWLLELLAPLINFIFSLFSVCYNYQMPRFKFMKPASLKPTTDFRRDRYLHKLSRRSYPDFSAKNISVRPAAVKLTADAHAVMPTQF